MNTKQPTPLDYLKLRVLSCYQEALMLKEGKMPAPRMCILYPTYSCNHRCMGCDYDDLNKTQKSFTDDEFENVIRQLVSIGVKSVEMCGGGEPTLHKYLPKAFHTLKDNGIAVGLLTNGTNLTDEIQEFLVKHGSYCRVSVEAGSEEVFNRYKRPKSAHAGFGNVQRNMSDLIRLRNSRKGDTNLQISFKYTIDMNNYSDVGNAIELAYKLNVDSIQFKLTRNVPTEILDETIIRFINEQFEKYKKTYPDMIIMGDIAKSSLKKCKCWIAPLQLTVDPYGDVYICCYYRHRIEKHRLGNMFKQSLADIWYSPDHWTKMEQIDTADCNKYDCRFHYYNELMYDLVIKDIGQLHFI